MEYAQPRKQKNTLLWVILGVALSCLLVCGIGGAMVFNMGKGLMADVFSSAGCTMDIEAARSALRVYAAKNDGKLPDAKKWQDAAAPYFAEERAKATDGDLEDAKRMGIDFKQSDPKGVWGCTVGKKIHAFAFNEELSGKKLADIQNPYSTPLLFETTASKRNHYAKFSKQTPTPEMKIGPEAREFIVANVEGEVDIDSGSEVKVTTSPDSKN